MRTDDADRKVTGTDEHAVRGILVGAGEPMILTEKDLARAVASGMSPGTPVSALAHHPTGLGLVAGDVSILEAAHIMLNPEVARLSPTDPDEEGKVLSIRCPVEEGFREGHRPGPERSHDEDLAGHAPLSGMGGRPPAPDGHSPGRHSPGPPTSKPVPPASGRGYASAVSVIRREELIESMFSASPDAIVVADRQGVVVLASPSVETLFGYRPDELIGETVELLLPDVDRRTHVRHREAFAQAPAPRPMGAGLQLEGRRKNGAVFPIDVSLAPTWLDEELLVGAYVRDATERRRGENLLRFVNDVSHQALTSDADADTLTLACARARVLVAASDVWLAVPDRPDAFGPDRSGHGTLVVAAADGSNASCLIGAAIADDVSLAAEAMSAAAPVVVGDLRSEPRALPEARAAGLGPAVYLPMLAEDGPVGTLVAARNGGSAPFNAGEIAALNAFAAATAVVTALARARESLEQMRMLSEQERIARDLHDSVIQRLFALGMNLQATERIAGSGPFVDRVRAAVATVDEVIREIRETIFDLNNPYKSLQDVRRRVREVVGDAVDQLGFTPRISFRGPVESALTDELSSQMLSVLREALSNCSRHAKAAALDVVVAAAQGWLTLSVADDGIGISDGPTAGNGLANMRARAEQLGGTLTLSRRSPSGTLLQWRVPIDPGAATT